MLSNMCIAAYSTKPTFQPGLPFFSENAVHTTFVKSSVACEVSVLSYRRDQLPLVVWEGALSYSSWLYMQRVYALLSPMMSSEEKALCMCGLKEQDGMKGSWS